MYHRVKKVVGKDRKVCGVLGGISKHLDPTWDPLVIRLVFLALAALSGFVFMFGAYFVLAILLHDEDPPEPAADSGEEPIDGELFKEKE